MNFTFSLSVYSAAYGLPDAAQLAPTRQRQVRQPDQLLLPANTLKRPSHIRLPNCSTGGYYTVEAGFTSTP